MKRYTIRRIDGHWTLFDGTGPIAHAAKVIELLAIAGVGAQVEIVGKRGKA